MPHRKELDPESARKLAFIQHLLLQNNHRFGPPDFAGIRAILKDIEQTQQGHATSGVDHIKGGLPMGQLQTVPFHGKNIFLVEHEGQPYTPVKPIVENLGIDWKSQHAKLVSNEKRWSVVMITMVAGDGKNREMLCLPVIKLSGFMYSIDANRVAPEKRPAVELYQELCDKALFDFWNTGHAVHPQAQTLSEPKVIEVVPTVTVNAVEDARKDAELWKLKFENELLKRKLEEGRKQNRFTDDEDKELISYVLRGYTSGKIAKLMNRYENSIETRRKTLKKKGKL